MVPPSFITPALPLHPPSRVSHSPHLPSSPPCPPRTPSRSPPPRMISGASLAGEAVVFTALASATYLFFRDSPTPSTPTPPPPPSRGVVGLTSTSSDTTPPAPTPPPPATSPPQHDTVGVDINDYLDSSSAADPSPARVAEELSWALSSLRDLSGVGAVVVVSSQGEVVLSDGELVREEVVKEGGMGRVVERVRETGKAETMQVGGNETFSFLEKEVRAVAVVPVGKGAVLVIGSVERDFWGEVENRVVGAVAKRLAVFVGEGE